MSKMIKKSIASLLSAAVITAMLLSAAGNAACAAETTTAIQDPYKDAKDAALNALSSRMKEEKEAVYVYKDFGLTRNHFTQKAKMAGKDQNLVMDMDENWRKDPCEGASCIRCEQITREGDWGGWLFMNGYLPAGESEVLLNDGSAGGQGLDLTGADALRFYAKGEKGGEKVEFFTCGFGYDAATGAKMVQYPDSTTKKSTGWIELTNEWQEYEIPLKDADLSYVVCGFGYVLNDTMNGNADNVFFLDGIRFTGEIKSAMEAPVMLRSYDTENLYIKNTAFTYDNALAAMAFLSEGKQEEAKALVDALVYAVQNDRNFKPSQSDVRTGEEMVSVSIVPRRVRNAYAAGAINAFPGWESGARLSGWYDQASEAWLEDRYQVGSNVGNTSYAALALLQYYSVYGGQKYLETACALMNWVLETCSDEGCGFTAGFDGWEEGDPPTVYPFTYKSIEHNIDAYAAFSFLYKFTGDGRYGDAAKSALEFIESMYDEENGLFMTGTLGDGVTPNTGVVVLDAQVWCAMALGEDFAPYEKALKTVEKMKTLDFGYPFCLENKNGGWWAEGTAYTALMYRGRGEEGLYKEAMDSLVSIQQNNGLFPAATVDHLSTGMELFDGSPWEYTKDPHIAPTAWFIMAANGFNPYVLAKK